VPAPEITFKLLTGPQAAGQLDELQILQAEICTAAPYGRADDPAGFGRRLTVQFRQPGFALAEARHGDYLVGYASGMPLRPSTSWWRNLTTAAPDDLTAEHPGRTFAVADLLVRAPWRRQGIARSLHDLLLAGRPEERATAVVLSAATPALRALGSWGWTRVARTRDPDPGAPVCDILLVPLPVS
jgi:GNAT superfamily N-acetyltransferase